MQGVSGNVLTISQWSRSDVAGTGCKARLRSG